MLGFKLAFISFVFSFLFSFLLIKSNLRFGKKEKPSWGGLVICISSLVGISLFPKYNLVQIWYILIPYYLMFIVGLIDDWKEFSPFWKLLAEAIPAVLIIIFGIHTFIIYLPTSLNLILSFLWLLIVTNALNMLDIKDGLALGVIIICLGSFLILGIIKAEMVNFLLIAIFLGACLGVFTFNFPRAKLYLGDNGSLSLGFFLAIMAINFSYAKETTPFRLLTPIVILGLPLFDFSYVTLRRFIKGKSIFRKSQDHLAILMEKKGFKQGKILITLWGLSLLFCLSSFIIQFTPFIIGFLSFIFVVLVCIIIGLRFAKT